jgi:hypothetical protein
MQHFGKQKRSKVPATKECVEKRTRRSLVFQEDTDTTVSELHVASKSCEGMDPSCTILAVHGIECRSNRRRRAKFRPSLEKEREEWSRLTRCSGSNCENWWILSFSERKSDIAREKVLECSDVQEMEGI